MIAKILPSAERTFGGVIGYNLKEQSELVSIENFPYMNIRMVCKHFRDLQNKNSRVRDQVFHGMLSFPKDEKIDSHTEMEIVRDYMKAMGYGEQVYAVFLHTDKEHRHLHIVSSRINRSTLKKINDSHEKRKSLFVRNKLMKKYNLSETINNEQGLVLELNMTITDVMKSHPMNITQLRRLCKEKDIKVIVTPKNGIMFQLRDESPIYSSKLPIFATKVTSLRQQMLNNSNVSAEIQGILSQRVENVVKENAPYDMKSFKLACAKDDIVVIQRGRTVLLRMGDYAPVSCSYLDVFKGEGNTLIDILKKGSEIRQKNVDIIKKELDIYYSCYTSKKGMEDYMMSKGVRVEYGEGENVTFNRGKVDVRGDEIGYTLSAIRWHDSKAKKQSVVTSQGRDLFERLFGVGGGVGANVSDDEDEEELKEMRRNKETL